MKNLILITATLLSVVSSKAQFTLEQTYYTATTGLGGEFFLTNLGNDEYKYVLYDYDSARINLYNLDHSPFLSDINVPLLSILGSYSYRLGYITRTLFDCDSTTIEYALMLNSPNSSVHPNFAVYRTDGTVLFSKDTVGTVFCVGCGSGSYEMHPIMNTPEGAKLYLFNYNVADKVQYFVYSLCGNAPDNISEFKQSVDFVKVFPNPTSGQVKFQITTPSHTGEYELTVFNTNFQEIHKEVIRAPDAQISLESYSLSAGTYLFSLKNANKVFQTGKFILIK